MKLDIIVYQDEDSMYISECPVIPGCVSQGDTEQVATENIKDAIKECLKVRAQRGMPLTLPTYQIEVAI